ncbi:MAG: putative DNA binding domain-containing protein [Erysipelotrichaceae bacterium]|nr:putative DNA binding domain-containing protein [Erysipelotrichaceae bacterium]
MEKRETEQLEFKKSTSELKEGVISLTSMLNKHGHGLLYFGIRNNGLVCGQQIGMDTTNDISREIRNNIRPIIVPEISVVEMDEKEVVRVEVSGEDKPYSAYGRYYVRSDDEDLMMTNRQLEEYFTHKQLDYSQWENELTEYGEEVVDEELLIRYINRGHEAGRISFLYKDTEDALTRLGLMKNGRLNNAGLYLFSNMKPWTLKLAVFATDERLNFIDINMFHGNIFECIDAAYQYIVRNIRWKAQITGMYREEIPEIPVDAIKEIVVNSFVHMRVNNGTFSEVYLTPTRVHIYNPGPLPAGTTPMDFAEGKQGPIVRNPLINTILYLDKTIESFGTGFARVFSLCRRNSVDVNYGNNNFGFFFEFMRRPIEYGDRPHLINDAIMLSDTDRQVYELISDNLRITKAGIAERIGKTEMTVHRSIRKLVEMGMVERIGSNKTGYWRAL